MVHAELGGVCRLFGPNPTAVTLAEREALYVASADRRATFAAAGCALKSMMGPMERIALLFGWSSPGRADQYGATIDLINSELARLEP